MRAIFLIILLTLIGCGGIDYKFQAPNIDEIVEVTTGSTFYVNEFMKGSTAMIGDRVFGSSGRMELSVASVGKDTFSLYHKEYYKPTSVNQYGNPGFAKSDNWHIKSGFTQKYDYDLKKSKTFSFQSLRFEILSISDSGMIKYRRVE